MSGVEVGRLVNLPRVFEILKGDKAIVKLKLARIALEQNENTKETKETHRRVELSRF